MERWNFQRLNKSLVIAGMFYSSSPMDNEAGPEIGGGSWARTAWRAAFKASILGLPSIKAL